MRARSTDKHGNIAFYGVSVVVEAPADQDERITDRLYELLEMIGFRLSERYRRHT